LQLGCGDALGFGFTTHQLAEENVRRRSSSARRFHRWAAALIKDEEHLKARVANNTIRWLMAAALNSSRR
jgi:hypothetical protein